MYERVAMDVIAREMGPLGAVLWCVTVLLMSFFGVWQPKMFSSFVNTYKPTV